MYRVVRSFKHICIVLMLCKICVTLSEISSVENKNSISYEFYTPTSEVVLNAKCRNLSIAYYNGIKNRVNWALHMLDASSKLPSGIFSGHQADLGQFDQCLSIETNIQNTTLRGKHCLVKFSLPSQNGVRWHEAYNEKDSVYSVFPYLVKSEEERWTLQWSICVPDACTAEDIKNHLRYTMPAIISELFGSSIDVSLPEKYCQTVETLPKWRSVDWAMCVLLITIGLLILGQTWYESYLERTGFELKYQIFTSFSLLRNGRELLRGRKGNQRFECLDGLRSISMLWIVLGHRVMIMTATPVANTNDIYNNFKMPASYIFIYFPIVVNQFFVVSGFLMMYNILKTKTAGDSYNIFSSIFHRYMRLTPALMATMLFTITIFRFVGSGPLWQTLPENEIRNCEVYWWSTLLYIQNFVNPFNQCLLHTWYLSVDMQLFVFGQLLAIPIYKWKRFGVYGLASCIIIFTLLSSGISIVNDLSAGISRINLRYESVYHFAVHSRAGPYLVGCLLAYVLFQKKESTIIKPVTNIIGWTGACFTLFAVIYCQYLTNQHEYLHNTFVESVYNGLQHVSWGCAMAWIIYACSKNSGGPVQWIFTRPVFHLLGKLTYSIYIVHFSFLLFRFSNVRTIEYFSNMDILLGFFSDTVMLIIFGSILALSFELPFRNIETICFGGRNKNRPSQKNIGRTDNNELETVTKMDIQSKL